MVFKDTGNLLTRWAIISFPTRNVLCGFSNLGSRLEKNDVKSQ